MARARRMFLRSGERAIRVRRKSVNRDRWPLIAFASRGPRREHDSMDGWVRSVFGVPAASSRSSIVEDAVRGHDTVFFSQVVLARTQARGNAAPSSTTTERRGARIG